MKNTRRKSLRINLDCDVRQVVADNQIQDARAIDLSRSGLSLSMNAPVFNGAIRHAWLQFHLPDGHRIRALGEMRHQTAQRDGIAIRGFRFKYIAPSERNMLNAFLSHTEAIQRTPA